MLNLLKRIFRRKPTLAPPPAPLTLAPGLPPPPPVPPVATPVSIFAVGQRITISGLSFRVARFGEHELHLRLEGSGRLTWRKRPARRAKARRG